MSFIRKKISQQPLNAEIEIPVTEVQSTGVQKQESTVQQLSNERIKNLSVNIEIPIVEIESTGIQEEHVITDKNKLKEESTVQQLSNQKNEKTAIPSVLKGPTSYQELDIVKNKTWPIVGADRNYTVFYQELVGGEGVYKALPVLDLSTLDRFLGGTNYPVV